VHERLGIEASFLERSLELRERRFQCLLECCDSMRGALGKGPMFGASVTKEGSAFRGVFRIDFLFWHPRTSGHAGCYGTHTRSSTILVGRTAQPGRLSTTSNGPQQPPSRRLKSCEIGFAACNR